MNFFIRASECSPYFFLSFKVTCSLSSLFKFSLLNFLSTPTFIISAPKPYGVLCFFEKFKYSFFVFLKIATNSSNYSLGFKSIDLKKFEKFDALNLESNYYLRIMTKDIPGVLSKITNYFDESNISVEKILQIPDNNNEIIPIIISTHKVKKNELMIAIKKIQALNFVMQNISIIPIDQNF